MLKFYWILIIDFKIIFTIIHTENRKRSSLGRLVTN
jgi:hypothetical protein